MRRRIRQLEQAIGRLRHGLARRSRTAGPARPGWWVLLQGEPFAGLDFAARDAARQKLLEIARAAGMRPAECVWVWDETDRAQLVAAALPTRDEARLLAARLRVRGLSVRVKREEPEG